MPISQASTDKTNAIYTAAAGAVGLIFALVTGLGTGTPAIQVKDASSNVNFQVNHAGDISGSGLTVVRVLADKTAKNCDTIDSTSTGMLLCGVDAQGINSGSVLTIGNRNYVKKQGDTMTGALTINLTSGFLGLKLLNTESGNILHAEKQLSSSGTIRAVGNMISDSTVSGAVVRARSYSPRLVGVFLFSGSSLSSLTTGLGKAYIPIEQTMSGYTIDRVSAFAQLAGTTNATTLNIRDANKGNRSIFSTKVSLDSGKTDSLSAATPYVFQAGNLDVSGGDRLLIDVSTISTTAPTAVSVILELIKP